MTNILNKMKEICKDGKYSIIEANATKNEIFSIPFLYNKSELDYDIGNINLCCVKYLDYIYENNKISIISGSHVKYYRDVILDYEKLSLIDISRDRIITYNPLLYKENDIIDMYNQLDLPDFEQPRTRRKRSVSLFALPTGTISMLDVAKELNRAGKTISLGDSDVRTLAGRPSGQIAMSDLRGKSSQVTYTMGVGDMNGDGNTAMANVFGFSSQHGASNMFGSMSPNKVEGSSLYIVGLYSAVLKDQWTGTSLNLYPSAVAPDGNYKGVKHTNYVDVTIVNHGTFRFNFDGTSVTYGSTDVNLCRIIRNAYRGQLQVKFRWFN